MTWQIHTQWQGRYIKLQTNNYFEKINVLRQILGDCDYKYPFPEIAFYCPKCKHRKKKLMLNIDKDVYKCWICGPSFAGSISKLIKFVGNQSLLFEWKKLTNDNFDADIDIKELIESSLTSVKIRAEKKYVELPIESKDVLNNGLELNPYLNYLLGRGISKNLAKKYNIMFADSGNYGKRLIFPSYDTSGDLNYFVARSIYDNSRKYINPAIDKNSIIFNEIFIDWNQPLILVEGVFDAIKTDYNCVPILGSSFHGSLLLEKIMKYKPTVYLMLDKDARKKQIDFSESLLEWGMKVYNVLIDEKDPGAMTRKEIYEAIKSAELASYKNILKERINEN